jgi:DNA ligase-associated metallophosphoesterase
MTPAPIHLGGERLLLDPMGGLAWPEAGVLAVADLHLEKGTAAARRGQLVPPWDTGATLDRLARLVRRWEPGTLVLLGDSFHDARGAARLAAADRARLAGLAEGRRVVWVLGNHDPVAPEGLPGEAVTLWEHGPLTFRHEARRGAAAGGEVSGHFHPKAAVLTRAGRVSRPCFVIDARRVVLPALGAYTGGLDVGNPAIAGLFPRGGRAFLLGEGRLFSFTLGQIGRQAAPA